MNRIVFVDFDRTLFNLDLFIEYIDSFLVTNFEVRPGDYVATISGYYVGTTSQGMRLYDHQSHIQELTGRSWQFVTQLIQEEIEKKGSNFYYHDSFDFLLKGIHEKQDIRILTFGNKDYQGFKMATNPIFAQLGLKVYIVQESKGHFLQTHFPESQGILIDDMYPLELPEQWQHILMCRDTYPAGVLPDTQKIVTSLDNF